MLQPIKDLSHIKKIEKESEIYFSVENSIFE
jgi:hypothetical protein